MYQQIMEAPGEAGSSARYKIEIALHGPAIRGYSRGPEALYRIYEVWRTRAESEANK